MGLLYYAKEREIYKKEFDNILDIATANSIIKKLIRHYKLEAYDNWKFTNVESSRCISIRSSPYNEKVHGKFRFSRTYISIGVICHELAHALETIRYGKSGHTKRHFNIMKRLINYCRKVGYVKDWDMLISVSGRERQGMSCAAIQMGGLVCQQRS
jgi:hypothetical protein